jgi:hypothetical protein
MNPILRAGDRFESPTGINWIVRSAIPGRLRICINDLSTKSYNYNDWQFAAADLPELDYLDVNVKARSLVLVHVEDSFWRYNDVQKLINLVHSKHRYEYSDSFVELAEDRGPFIRLLLALFLLIGQSFLLEVWLFPIGILFLPPLLFPLLVNIKTDLSRGKLPTESLDLAWLVSLIARGELSGFATEIALDNGNKAIQGRIVSSSNYGEDLCAAIESWQRKALFPLAAPQAGSKRVDELRIGDRLLIKSGTVVPLDGYVVAGSGLVCKSLLDGDSALIPVQGFQPLPLGVQLVEGELVFKLTQSLTDQPVYHQLFNLAQHHPAPFGIENARSLHRKLLPFMLGSGLIALGLGRIHAAAGLMQFDPMNDWQLSASIAYRGVRHLLAEWGVSLRRGNVLDRLAKCRVLVVSEGAICFGINRSILEIRSLDSEYSANNLIEIIAGFRIFSSPGSIPLYPLQLHLKENDLEPRHVEAIKAVEGCGLNGFLSGLNVYIGGGFLLRHLGIPRPNSMPQEVGRHWLFVVVNGNVVGGLLFEDKLDQMVLRSLRRLKRYGWILHLVSTWHGDTLDGIARQLELPSKNIHPSIDLVGRMELIRSFDRKCGPVAYLGSALIDSGAFAEADIALAVSDGSFSLPSEMADILLPAKRLDRLVDCNAIAKDIAAANRVNLYIILFPHSAALLLSLLLLLDPILAVLLADIPMVLVELNNLSNFNHMKNNHLRGWRSHRKRTSKRRPSKRAPQLSRASKLSAKV